MPWRSAPAWPDRPPPLTVADDVELLDPAGHHERLVDDHAQDRPGEIDLDVAAVDGDPTRAGLDPDPRDRVLAAPGRIGAALRVELRARRRDLRLGRDGPRQVL